MKDLTRAVIETGVVSPEAMNEFSHWRAPIEFDETANVTPVTVAAAMEALQTAAETTDQGPIVMTDPDAVAQYKATAKPYSVHLEHDTQVLDIAAEIGRNTLGEYLMPYNDAALIDVLTNGQSYLQERGPWTAYAEDAEESVLGPKIYPASAVALHLGDQMVFIAMRPADTRVSAQP